MDDYQDDCVDLELCAWEQMIVDSIKERSLENAKSYLGVYGDAVEERLNRCLFETRQLLAAGMFTSALVMGIVAVELIIRYMLLMPLIQGALLVEEWAELITETVIPSKRSSKDKTLLPRVLKVVGFDLSTVRLPNGQTLWGTLINYLVPKRNRIVHQGESASREEAELALACAEALRQDVVGPIATRLGFTLERTGKWCEIRGEDLDNGLPSFAAGYSQKSPF